jgi:hypothetical protein
VSGILEALIETTVAEGPLKTLTTLDRAAGEVAHRWPTFVHGRDAVLFTSIGQGGAREARIDALDLRTMQRSVVVERGTSPLHSTTGHLLFARDDGMFAAPFDAATLKVTGPAVRVLEQVMVGEDGSMKAALSDNGVLVYALPSGSQLVWVDRTERETPASPDTRGFWNPRLSPDDSRLLFEGDGFIWTLDFARDTYARFAGTPNAIAYPIWLEGGQRWIYSREQDLFVGGASLAGGPTPWAIDDRNSPLFLVLNIATDHRPWYSRIRSSPPVAPPQEAERASWPLIRPPHHAAIVGRGGRLGVVDCRQPAMGDFTAIPRDTSPQAHDVQRDIDLRMGAAGRVAAMFRLNDAVRRRRVSRLRETQPLWGRKRMSGTTGILGELERSKGIGAVRIYAALAWVGIEVITPAAGRASSRCRWSWGRAGLGSSSRRCCSTGRSMPWTCWPRATAIALAPAPAGVAA